MNGRALYVGKFDGTAIGLVDREYSRFFGPGNSLRLHRRPLRYLIDPFRYLWKVRDYDTIVFSSYDILPILLRPLARRPRVVMIIHHIEGCWVLPFITRLSLAVPDFIVAASEETRRDLQERWSVAPQRIVVIDQGISAAYYPEPIKGFLPYEYVLYVGDEYPRKNLETALEAFALLARENPELRFVKLGTARFAADRERTDARIRARGLQERVVLKREYASEETLRRYYSNAALLLFPSLREGFGRTVVEAMACGCPVVTSDRPPMSDLAASQMRADPEDAEALRAAMQAVLSDAALRARLAAAGVAVGRDYTWKRFAADIERVCVERFS